MQKPVYLDYHATTPVDERVLAAMLPYFGPKFGNAASRGQQLRMGSGKRRGTGPQAGGGAGRGGAARDSLHQRRHRVR